ncbi:type II secretion system protein [bacterium]|nr:type II secretion system protein [bacterium]
MNYGNQKRAFTMAEILLSLSIIGIVAAITIPSLTGKTSSKQFAATYKKAYSTIAQALTLGATDGMDASSVGTKSANERSQSMTGKILEDNVGARRLNSTWTIKIPTDSSWAVGKNQTDKEAGALVPGISQPGEFALQATTETYVLKDGLAHLIINFPTSRRCYAAGKPVYIGSPASSPIDYSGKYCQAFIDVNGPKGPNQIITCDNQDEVMPAKFNLHITSTNCTLTSDSITDIYPIVIYDDKIMPATPAAAAVLEDKY